MNSPKTLLRTFILPILFAAAPFARADKTPPLAPVLPAPSDVIISGEIDTPGHIDRYTFTGAPGQRLYFDVVSDDAFAWWWGAVPARLVSPSGTTIFHHGSASDFGPFTLVEPGTYTLTFDVGGDFTGRYEFQVLDASAAPLVTPGPRITGVSGRPYETSLYRFNGVAGQRITLDSIASMSSLANWYLVGPGNEQLLGGGIQSDLGPATLPVTGEYLIVVSTHSPNSLPFEYWFEVRDTSDTAVANSGFGEVRTGSIAVGETRTFNFTANAGTPIYLDNLRRDGAPLYFEVKFSDATVVFLASGGDYGPAALPRSGNYTVTVRGHDPASSIGDFSFRLLDLAAAPELPLNSAITGNTTLAYQTDVWRVPVSAGQVVYYDGIDADGDDVTRYLYSWPRLSTLQQGNADYDMGPTIIPFTGTYFQVIETAVPNDYSFRIFSVENPPGGAVALDTPVGGALMPVPASALQVNGSYVKTNLRARSETDDWRVSQSITALRNDAAISFTDPNWGSLFSVGFTAGPNGENDRWENFSVQWDGKITITTPGTRLFLRSHDGSRLWVDANKDGTFASNQDELVGNGWGSGGLNLPTVGSAPLAAGEYNIRVQFEHSSGAPAEIQLLMDSGASLPPFTTRLYHFSATAGQRLYIDNRLSVGGSLTTALYNQRGDYITQTSGQNDIEFVAPYTGQYVLGLHNGSPTPVSFHFVIVTADSIDGALNIGQILSGTINSPGERHRYTFEGRAGQLLYYDALENNNDPVVSRLFSAFGSVSPLTGNNADYEPGFFRLPFTGTYTLEFSGNDTAASYKVRLLDLDALPTAAVGDTFTGSLQPLENRFVAIDLAAARRIFVHNLERTGNFTLTAFDSAAYLTSVGQGGDLVFTPTIAGRHFISVHNPGQNVAPYAFRILRPTIPVTPINFGADMNVSIPSAGDEAWFTFSGSAGQKLFYDAIDLTPRNARVRIVGPSAENVMDVDHTSDVGLLTLPATGTYRLEVSANGATVSNIKFRLLDLTSAPLIELGTPVTSALNPRSSARVYRINGVAGHRIAAESIAAGATAATWSLVGTYTEVYASASITATLPTVTLPYNGTYYLVLQGTAESIFPLDYSIRVTDVAPSAIATLGFGEVKSGALDASQTATFDFSATAGTHIYLDNQNRATGIINYELRNADGALLLNTTAEGFTVLPTSGVYTMTVRNVGGAPADFAFRVLNLSVAPTLQTGVANRANLERPYQTEVYRLRLEGGRPYYFDNLGGTPPAPAVYVYRPDFGHVIASSGDFGAFAQANSGDHYVVIENPLATAAVRDFVFHDLSTALQIDFNTIIGGPSSGLNPVPASGLAVTGSYINGSLRARPDMDDWRVSQTIAGARADVQIAFDQQTWGARSEVGLTGGSDSDWEDFSVQWDGTITIPANTRLYTRSDDGSRLWIDVNNDGAFDNAAPEFFNHGWGSAQSLVTSAGTQLLPAGTYKIRAQYEEGTGDNRMYLLSETGPASIPTDGIAAFSFNAVAGRRYMVDNINPQATRGHWAVIDPWNQSPVSADFPYDMEFVATRTGRHILYINAGSVPALFYGFRVIETAAPAQTLQFGAVQSGSLSSPGDSHVFTLAATVGQRIFYDSLETDFASISVYLLSPSGLRNSLNYNSDYDYGPLILTETGEYRLVIDGDGDNVGSYRFRVLDVAAQPVIALDTLITGQLQPAHATLLRFNVPAGMPLFVDGGNGPTTAAYTIINPVDSAIVGTSLSSDMETTVTGAGEYVMILGANNNDASHYAFRIYAGNHAPVIPAIAHRSIHQRKNLRFTIPVSDPDEPNDTFATTIHNLPAGATFDPASGIFTWTPSAAQEPGVYQMIVEARDDGSPSLATSRSFSIEVLEVEVTLSNARFVGGKFEVTVNGPLGFQYVLQSSGNFRDWLDVHMLTPTAETFTMADELPEMTNAYYRVVPIP